MRLLFLAFVFLLVSLYIERRRLRTTRTTTVEPFSLEFKTSLDGKMFKSVNVGATQVVKNIHSQAKGLTSTVVSILPFRDKVRQWHRRWRRKNM